MTEEIERLSLILSTLHQLVLGQSVEKMRFGVA